MSEYAVFCGLDVGKAEHHAVALDPTASGARPAVGQRRDRVAQLFAS